MTEEDREYFDALRKTCERERRLAGLVKWCVYTVAVLLGLYWIIFCV